MLNPKTISRKGAKIAKKNPPAVETGKTARWSCHFGSGGHPSKLPQCLCACAADGRAFDHLLGFPAPPACALPSLLMHDARLLQPKLAQMIPLGPPGASALRSAFDRLRLRPTLVNGD